MAALFSTYVNAEDNVLPRLSGVIIGPRSVAIFATSDGASLVVGEGDKVGAYTVETIRPDGVVVNGPDGARLSELEPQAKADRNRAGTGAPTALGEIETGGLEIGRLAIQRDNCVRHGLLLGARIDAENRVRELLRLIAGAPPPGKAPDGVTPQSIATATSAGLDAARRSDVITLKTKVACGRLDRAWQQRAAGLGVR